METDSFIVYIKAEDIYADIAKYDNDENEKVKGTTMCVVKRMLKLETLFAISKKIINIAQQQLNLEIK